MPGPRGGRPPKPTALHEAQGTFRPDRHGEREQSAEAQVRVAAPDPPRHLTAAEKRVFRGLVDELRDAHILSLADTKVIEAAAVMYARALQARKAVAKLKGDLWIAASAGSLKPHPAVETERRAWSEYLKFARELGATPSSRASLSGWGPSSGSGPSGGEKGEPAGAGVDPLDLIAEELLAQPMPPVEDDDEGG